MNLPKTHWNYRLIRKPTGDADDPFTYEVHEVHWADGKPVGASVEPVTFGGSSPEEAAKALSMALKDALCEPWIDISAVS